MMKFFANTTENKFETEDEERAMLLTRLRSLEYNQAQLNEGSLAYAFRDEESGRSAYYLYRVRDLEELDALIKRDPAWAYSAVDVTPVTTTAGLVREMLDALDSVQLQSFLATSDEMTFSQDEMDKFDEDEEPIEPDGMYTLAKKASKDNKITVTEPELYEMWARALVSQKMHLNSDVEFTDHNPVGQSVGLLIGKGDRDRLKDHVSATPIYPDTDVTYTNLNTLTQSWRSTAERLTVLGAEIPSTTYFDI